MTDTLAQQIDVVNDNETISTTELQTSLEEGGVLENLDTDPELQEELKGELESIDSDIESSLAQKLISQYETIGEIEQLNRSKWQQKLFLYGQNHASLLTKRRTNISTFQNKEQQEQEENYTTMRSNVDVAHRDQNTFKIIKDTGLYTTLHEHLGDEKEVKTLSNNLDATWHTFFQGLFPGLLHSEKSKEILKHLATGASFAFMDRYTKVKTNKKNESAENSDKGSNPSEEQENTANTTNK